MARTKTNKSAAIREAHRANPTAGPSEIIASLAEKKIKVSPQLVSNVITRESGQVGRRAKGRKASGMTLKGLEAAADFAREMGGLQQAQAALAVLDRLR